MNEFKAEVISELTPIANDIIESMPDISQGAIDGIEQTESPPESPPELTARTGAAALTDADGNTFSSDLHQTDEHGNPKVSSKNKLLKKRGRKKGSAANQSRPKSSIGGIPGGSGSPNEPAQLSASQQQQAAVTGQVSASMLITVSMMVGGNDFAPKVDPATGIDERAALSQAFTDYYIATGRTDLPPNVALVATIGMYVLPRFAQPTVQTRFKEKGSRIYNWWQNRKLKKQQAKKVKEHGPQSNIRDDGKRQNNPGETTSANLQK